MYIHSAPQAEPIAQKLNAETNLFSAAAARVENTGSCLAVLDYALDYSFPTDLLKVIADLVGPVEPDTGTFMFRSSESRRRGIWSDGFLSRDQEWFVHSNAAARECIVQRLKPFFLDTSHLPANLQTGKAQEQLVTDILQRSLSIEDTMKIFWTIQTRAEPENKSFVRRYVNVGRHSEGNPNLKRIVCLVHVPKRQRTKSRMPVFALYFQDFLKHI